jgi:hypothetical protein
MDLDLVLDFVQKNPACTCEQLASLMNEAPSILSVALRVLRKAGMLESAGNTRGMQWRAVPEAKRAVAEAEAKRAEAKAVAIAAAKEVARRARLTAPRKKRAKAKRPAVAKAKRRTAKRTRARA